MLDQHPPWAAQAWQHWHRPWAVTHASWLSDAPATGGDAHEVALRLHYPAWCDHYALDPTLTEFADTLWWRLLALSPASFEQVSQRVGLTLLFAADQRRRLLRGAKVDLAVTRWALERSHFIPEPVATAVHDAASSPVAEPHAALSLRWCLDEKPSLWARMRLRFAREHVEDEPPWHDPIDPTVHTHLGRLWRTAARAALEEGKPS